MYFVAALFHINFYENIILCLQMVINYNNLFHNFLEAESRRRYLLSGSQEL